MRPLRQPLSLLRAAKRADAGDPRLYGITVNQTYLLGWPQERKVSGQEAHHPLASTHSDWDGLEERASHQHSYGFGKLIPEPKQKTSPQSGS
jgi:hypothetical protein